MSSVSNRCEACGYTESHDPNCSRDKGLVPSLDLSRLRESIDKACETIDYLREEKARLVESNLDLQAVLLHAVTVIKRWHGADLEIPKEDENELWQMYYDNAPEMKPIREALKP